MTRPTLRERLGFSTVGEALTLPPRDPRVRARSLFYKFAGGGILAALAIPLSGPGADAIGLAACAVVAMAVGGWVLYRFDELHDATVPSLLATGTVLITGAVRFGGTSAVAYPLFYIWVSLSAYYFLSRRQAHLQMGLVAVCYATTAVTTGRWLLTVGTVCLAGLLIGLLRERTELLTAQLQRAAMTDALTGLANRRAFDERLAEELAAAERSGAALTLLLVDVDRFKETNDALGHARGDLVLTGVADLLREATRSADCAARIGGDEFALLLEATEVGPAYAVAERLLAAVRSTFADEPVATTASIGLAAYPQHAASGAGLHHAADRALYAAKAMGRDRAVVDSAALDGLAA
jgi:diguanylate cyclase (GGDEF)-like protein